MNDIMHKSEEANSAKRKPNFGMVPFPFLLFFCLKYRRAQNVSNTFHFAHVIFVDQIVISILFIV